MGLRDKVCSVYSNTCIMGWEKRCRASNQTWDILWLLVLTQRNSFFNITYIHVLIEMFVKNMESLHFIFRYWTKYTAVAFLCVKGNSLFYLVPICVTPYHNTLGPAGHQTWNVFTNDCLAEYSSSQNVTDSTIGWLPHLLQLELWTKHTSKHVYAIRQYKWNIYDSRTILNSN